MRVALVTGGGTGIGRVSALGLADAGFNIVVSGRRGELIEATAAAIREKGGDASAIQSDITSAMDVANLFRVIKTKYGRLDLLFNNAGFNPPNQAFEQLTVGQWRDAIEANLTGAFLCTQQAFRLMTAQQPKGGRIINNGSISAHVPRPHSVAYTVSKHAITGLTRSTALDGRDHNIACGQIDIGNALTEMTSEISHGCIQPDGSTRPEPTFDANHVADAVVFMATLPLTVNVPFMTIMATSMPYIGRG